MQELNEEWLLSECRTQRGRLDVLEMIERLIAERDQARDIAAAASVGAADLARRAEKC